MLSASGNDSSATQSAIATGKITITNEAQQQQLTGKTADETVASLNRDTDNTAGKLNNNFDKAQVEEAFTVTKALINETSTFMVNRAKEADKAKQEYDQAVKDGADVTTLERLKTVKEDAEKWGPGGSYGQAVTVLQVAVGGNVTSGMTNLVQNAVVAYVQSLAAEEVKKIADSFEKESGVKDEASETIRAALHAIVGCAGAAATNQNCSSAALGAASSVVINNVLDQLKGIDGSALSAEEKENRKNLVGSVIVGIATAVGGDAAVANGTAQIEMENNWLAVKQVEKMQTELANSKSALEKLKIAGKWAYTSANQDVLTTSGVGKGLIDSGINDVKGLAAFLSDPIKGLEGLQQIITSPEARAQLGEIVFNELDAKLGRMKIALEQGGDRNAEQLGQDLGGLIWQIGSVATGVGGTAKGGVMLAKAGVAFGESSLKVFELTATLMAKESKGLGGVVKLTDVGMEFGNGIVKQGKPFESFVQSKLPEGTLDLNMIKNNFKTFDHLTPDGVAVSSKTMDTAAVTYQTPSKITYQLNKYVDEMASFTADGKGKQIITNDMLSGKQMQLGIPATASAEQIGAIAKSIEYASSKGIEIVVTKVK